VSDVIGVIDNILLINKIKIKINLKLNIIKWCVWYN